jgi:hypothetical protein
MQLAHRANTPPMPSDELRVLAALDHVMGLLEHVRGFRVALHHHR